GAEELEVPIEVPQQFFEQTSENIAAVSSIAKEIGMPTETAQGLVDYAVALAVSDSSGVSLEDPDACVTVLTHRYGRDEAQKIINDAQAAVRKLGPKAAAYLNATGHGNSPAVLAALAALHRGDLRMSPAKAKLALDEMRKDPRGPYRNANHAGHKAA